MVHLSWILRHRRLALPSLPSLLLALIVPGIVAGQGQGSRPKKDLIDHVAQLATGLEPTRKVVYKSIGSKKLYLHFFDPQGLGPRDKRACFLIIHGGGWVGGEPRRMYPYASHYARLGMVAVSLQYRLLSPQAGISVSDCVKDGRSAVRYLRRHADQLGIDTEKIIVGGASAGGHVAAGTALFDGIDEKDEDVSVSCVPNALVLLYAVLDTSPEGYGNAKVGNQWQELSPLLCVKANMPPTLVFHGTADTVAPFAGVRAFHEAMLKAGNRSELVVQQDGRHGYFLYDPLLFQQTLDRIDAYLSTIGLFKPDIERGVWPRLGRWPGRSPRAYQAGFDGWGRG